MKWGLMIRYRGAVAIGAALLACPMSYAGKEYPPDNIKPVTVLVVKKRPFSERHPRLWKQYRRARKVCLVLEPIVSVTANAVTILHYMR